MIWVTQIMTTENSTTEEGMHMPEILVILVVNNELCGNSSNAIKFIIEEARYQHPS